LKRALADSEEAREQLETELWELQNGLQKLLDDIGRIKQGGKYP